jgi:uncharacterized protein YbaR (Trm112 family)
MERKIIEILACPVCKGKLEKDENTLKCCKCRKKYEIKGDIPILLPESAD